MLYQIEYQRTSYTLGFPEIESRTAVVEAPAYRVATGGVVRFDDRLIRWMLDCGSGWDEAYISAYRPVTFNRSGTLGAMSSLLAEYDMAGMRLSRMSLERDLATNV